MQAQITLTAANNYSVGEVYSYNFVNATGISPGDSGENITWDFSTLSSPTLISSTLVDPSSLSGGSNFPNANIGVKDDVLNNESYYYTSPNAQGFYGAISNGSQGTTYVTYTDPQDWVQYPMTYQDQFSDTFAGTVETSAVFDRSGTAEVVADGYGTLITPAGTYNNVIRLKTTMDYGDSFNGTPFITYEETRYLWYDAGRGFPLMTLSMLNGGGASINSLSYLEISPLATSSPLAQTLGLSVSPNPASDWINIEYELTDQLAVNASIRNLMGQEVLNISNEVQHAGAHQLGIDLSGLSNGTYFLHLVIDKKVASHKVLIQR